MRINELIELYAKMRIALMVTSSIAMWGIALWMTGEMALALLLGLNMLPLILCCLPSAKEVKRTLKTRKTSDHIWYLIEDRTTGETRMYK